MEEIRVIEVKQSVFADNCADAERLRQQLREEKTFLLNLMSSPGAGKTTLLRRLAAELEGKLRLGVMEADIDSDVDARTLQQAGVNQVLYRVVLELSVDMTVVLPGGTKAVSCDQQVVLEEVLLTGQVPMLYGG